MESIKQQILESSEASKSNLFNIFCNISKKFEILPLPKSNNGSLYPLYMSEFFTLELILEYLIKKEEISHIDVLVNRLFYKNFTTKTFFYLPQFCSLIRGKNYTESLEKYIVHHSAEDNMFAVCANWIINSYINDLNKIYSNNNNNINMNINNNNNNNVKKFEGLIERLESSLINGIKISDIQKIGIGIDYFKNKQNKLNQFDNTLFFYTKIKNLCKKLKTIKDKKDFKDTNSNNSPNDLKTLRKEYLTSQLKKFNHDIKNQILLNKKYPENFNPFIGYILPFENYGNYVIVRFLTEYSICFNTKERVPIKITMELISLDEINQKKFDDYEESSENNNNDDVLDNDLSDNEENKSPKPSQKRILDINSINNNNKNEDNEKVEKIIQSIRYDNEHPNELPNLNIIDNTPLSTGLNNNNDLEDESILSSIEDPFGEDYINVENSIKQNSKFKNYKSLSIVNIICKSNDDLRQEVMTMQLIKKFDEIFKKENLPLQLHPYEIVITSSSSGIIEYLPDTISIDALKKKLLDKKVNLNDFCRYYFRDNFEEFQKNFVESLAAYCIVCYLLQIKDRHNGNILLDKKGRIIHIDFGFILGISPGGNLNFENAPFKITKDYIMIMDGQKSEMFFYFVSIIARGLQMVRKYANIFCNIVEAMGVGVPMPCFNGRNYKDVVASLKDRFLTNCSDQEVINVVENLVDKSVNNWRTSYYDSFQKYTNGIIP